MKISLMGKDSVTPESILGIENEHVSELEGLIIIGFRKDDHFLLQ